MDHQILKQKLLIRDNQGRKKELKLKSLNESLLISELILKEIVNEADLFELLNFQVQNQKKELILEMDNSLK